MDDEQLPEKQEIQTKFFPNLKLEEFEVTSPIDFFYNCFAWAAGYNDKLMQPSTNTMYHWLTDDIGETLDNFEKQFNLLWFKEKTDNQYEEGFEKVAFYVKGSEVTHASRQLENGWWTTKLGQLQDITHKTLEGLEGEEYGVVKLILKRPKNYMEDIQTATTKKNKTSKEFENFKNLARNIINVPKKEVDELKEQQKNKAKKKAEK